MALVNNEYELAVYTNDFGREIKNFTVKFGNDVPVALLTSMGYTKRVSKICRAVSGNFKPRALVATLASGAVHRFPLPVRTGITTRVEILKKAGAVCIDLEGEQHGLVLPVDVGVLKYDSQDYIPGIPDRGVKRSLTYAYQSDVLIAGVTRLKAAIESLPATLAAIQQDCMADIKQTKEVCTGGGLGISARAFILQHNSLKSNGEKGSVRRLVRVSGREKTALISCAGTASVLAKCLGYVGESVKRIEQIV